MDDEYSALMAELGEKPAGGGGGGQGERGHIGLTRLRRLQEMTGFWAKM